jgi:hypothetical protein
VPSSTSSAASHPVARAREVVDAISCNTSPGLRVAFALLLPYSVLLPFSRKGSPLSACLWETAATALCGPGSLRVHQRPNPRATSAWSPGYPCTCDIDRLGLQRSSVPYPDITTPPTARGLACFLLAAAPFRARTRLLAFQLPSIDAHPAIVLPAGCSPLQRAIVFWGLPPTAGLNNSLCLIQLPCRRAM